NLGKPSRSSDTTIVYVMARQSPPQTVYVPVERRIGTAGREAPLRTTLQELAGGTTAREKQAGCTSYFDSTGPGVLRDLALDGDEVTIDFKGEAMFALGATTATSFFLGQLTRTVFRFPAINSIRLELDGSCKKFGEAIQTLQCEMIRRDER
ncbi:MAG: GerMN domain-containing protein, partial [Acidimicrobiia bacterium]